MVALLLPQPSQAQSPSECNAPQTQQAMNACAALEYREADAALNEAWKSARAFAKQIGQGDALLQAQRAWLTYRDQACAVQASPYAGGSIQPMVLNSCLAALTDARTIMLRDFKVN
ncbi:MAG: lysozyme inhibitor LprI family protein [Sulfitobacter sp.]